MIKVGVLPIACSRFKALGNDTSKVYEDRVQERLDITIKKLEDFAQVINCGQIYTNDDVKKAMSSFYNNDVDCIFVFFLSWAEDANWIRFLRDMPIIPIFYAHVIPNITYGNTEDDDSFIEYLSTGGLVGALEGSGSITRMKRPMVYSSCGRIDEIIEDFKNFAISASIRSNLRNSNFGLLNNYNEVMWSTYVDPYLLFTKFGPELRFISVATLEDRYNAVSDERVDNCIHILTSKYESREDVELVHFKASMRCTLALEDIAKEMNISMMVLNDIGTVLYERIGLRPGFYPSPENNGKYTVVPEGDLGVGLAVYISKLASNNQVNIIEPAYLTENDELMVVHAGPNDYRDADGKTIIARDVRFAKTKWKHAGAPFAWHVFSPGLKTILHISQNNEGKFKMIALLAVALEIEHTLASYSHSKLIFPQKNTKDVMKRLIEEGVTQHYAISKGNNLVVFRHLSKMLDIEYVEI